MLSIANPFGIVLCVIGAALMIFGGFIGMETRGPRVMHLPSLGVGMSLFIGGAVFVLVGLLSDLLQVARRFEGFQFGNVLPGAVHNGPQPITHAQSGFSGVPDLKSVAYREFLIRRYGIRRSADLDEYVLDDESNESIKEIILSAHNKYQDEKKEISEASIAFGNEVSLIERHRGVPIYSGPDPSEKIPTHSLNGPSAYDSLHVQTPKDKEIYFVKGVKGSIDSLMDARHIINIAIDKEEEYDDGDIVRIGTKFYINGTTGHFDSLKIAREADRRRKGIYSS
jgi:hypothetical protein